MSKRVIPITIKNMMNNKKIILIIENEKNLLDALSKNIRDENFTVFTAKDGEEGLAQIKNSKPNLILLNTTLPKIDGFGVLEKMKKDNISIPVMVISNSGQPVDINKAIELGACDYLIKDKFEIDKIIKKIHRCLIIEQSGKPGAKKILIVEDDRFLLDLCVKRFNQSGYNVNFAVDGKEGLEKIIKHKPDLILLDLIIPGIDGFDVLKKVRADKNKSIAKIPIIVLSNLGQKSDVQKALKLGASDYLIKAHFTTDDIISKVKKHLKE